MAYKYFSQKLLNQDILDLNDVFVNQVDSVKESISVSFGLLDIVLYLKNRSKNFKLEDSFLLDYDYAIKDIISRYYNSINKPNPFLDESGKKGVDQYLKGEERREPVTTIDGKISPVPETDEEKKKGKRGRPPKVKPVEEPIEEEATEEDAKSDLKQLRTLLKFNPDNQEIKDAIEYIKEVYGLK